MLTFNWVKLILYVYLGKSNVTLCYMTLILFFKVQQSTNKYIYTKIINEIAILS